MEIDKQFLDSLQLCYRAYKHLDLYKCNESQVNVLNAKIGIQDIYNKPKIWTKNSKNSEFAVL